MTTPPVDTFPIDPAQLAAVALREAQRWEEQAIRWEAVARTLKAQLEAPPKEGE